MLLGPWNLPLTLKIKSDSRLGEFNSKLDILAFSDLHTLSPDMSLEPTSLLSEVYQVSARPPFKTRIWKRGKGRRSRERREGESKIPEDLWKLTFSHLRSSASLLLLFSTSQ